MMFSIKPNDSDGFVQIGQVSAMKITMSDGTVSRHGDYAGLFDLETNEADQKLMSQMGIGLGAHKS